MRAEVALGRAFLALGHTWRLGWHGLERLAEARAHSPTGNIIYALWHSSLAILTFTHRDRDVQILVSQHRDGEIIARILARMGYGLVRGSTRRGGREALFGLAKQLEQGRDVAVTVDGPVGPRYAVHSGVLLLARRTGRPIVPILATARHCAFLDTWDALRIPYPFSPVRVQHGAPIWLSKSARGAELADAQRQLENALRQGTVEEELAQGRRIDLRDLQDRRSYWERVSERADPPVALRAASVAYGMARRVERRLRPRPHGRGGRPWIVGVGNLEAGGTGKTPCVIALAAALTQSSWRVGVLTRGYGARLGRRHPVVYTGESAVHASDETRLIAAALPEAVVVVSHSKSKGLRFFESRTDLDVVVVDDALQSVGLRVDRHLVLLDWENPLGNGYVHPAGRLREPAEALRQAHALLFTRARTTAMPRHPAWSHLEPERCFLARTQTLGLRRADGARVDPNGLHGVGVALLSGIGRPAAFEASAQELATKHGFDIRRIVRVGDHAPLERALGKLASKLERIGCRYVVTTAKDAERLRRDPKADEPLLVLEQRLDVDSLGELLRVLVPRSSFRPRSSQSSRTATPERGSRRPT